jgi:dienelactone hydrolase
MDEQEILVTRRARFYTLGEPATADEVWFVIHGYGQLADEFAEAFQPLVNAHRAVVAPEALNRYYKEGGTGGSHADTPVGTTWMTRRHREGEIADYVEYLDKLAAAVSPAGARLGVLAFSQGVATAWRWVALGVSTFDRVVMWAGSMPPDLDVARYRARVPSCGVDLVYGTEDEMAPWIGVDSQRERLDAAGVPFAVRTFSGGHRIDRRTLLDLAGA